ncbi:MerR family transcriptional regulator [Brevibacterium oceani]|uniref:MerR family transcriptional regulator n=1 Tax=Brevibacterium oceani TaxID=358099 RepID=UPI0015E63571|nr:MerR family transcriptional regulator [Brevibacterium oceani]
MNTSGWSTAEVARLAGVSARAVRYYHEVGILERPRRLANGYKSYDVSHLIRLLRVRRLTSLGLTLEQIRALDSHDIDVDDVFESLKNDISARIGELQDVLRNLRGVLSGEIHGGLPPGFDPADIGARMTDRDEAALAVLDTMLPEEKRAGLRRWLAESSDSAADDEFEALSENAGEDYRAELANRMLPAARAAARNRDRTRFSGPGSSRDIGIALRGIYNPAQMDVLTRVATLLEGETEGETEESESET